MEFRRVPFRSASTAPVGDGGAYAGGRGMGTGGGARRGALGQGVERDGETHRWISPHLSMTSRPSGHASAAISRSADQAPLPFQITTSAMAMTRMWYSNPSPCCAPNQFMKNPTFACTIATATTMFARMPKAATRVKRPVISPREPKNSAQIASAAKIAGTCICPSKYPIVPLQPYPPNQPSIFWAPWGNITRPSATRRSVSLASFVVWNRNFFITVALRCDGSEIGGGPEAAAHQVEQPDERALLGGGEPRDHRPLRGVDRGIQLRE